MLLMKFQKKNNNVFPEYVQALRIATDVIYEADGQRVADLLVSEYQRIDYNFDNIVEERIVDLGGEHYLDSDKKKGSTGFSYVGLWSEHKKNVFEVE